MFDPVTYFQNLTNSLKLTKDKYRYSKISGITELEEILANRKNYLHHVAVDDSQNGVTLQGEGRGYFERRPYTVFLCSVGKTGNMDQREIILEELKTIYRKFLSKLILDEASGQTLPLDTSRTPFYELPGHFADGAVGIYFIITVDNSINLSYDSADWE